MTPDSRRAASDVRRRSLRAAVCGLLTLAGAGATSARATADDDRPDLRVDARTITLSKHRIGLTVEQSGSLAGRPLAVFVFVDGNGAGRYEIGGQVTRLEVTGLELAPGSHEILAKSGTHEARDTFRYVRAIYPVSLLLFLAAAVGVALVSRSRSRRRARLA